MLHYPIHWRERLLGFLAGVCIGLPFIYFLFARPIEWAPLLVALLLAGLVGAFLGSWFGFSGGRNRPDSARV